MLRMLSTATAAPGGDGVPEPVPPPRLRLRRARVSRGRVVTLLALAVVGGFLALQVGRELHANFTITQRAEDLRAESAAVEAGNDELAAQLAYLRSDAYISQEARRISNLGAPDERVLIIPPGAEAALPPALVPAAPEKPMLERWLELFFGS